MTPPTTDTSREAVEALANGIVDSQPNSPNSYKARETLVSLLTERDAALAREKSLKDNTKELRQLRREFNAVADKYSDLSDRYADLTEKLIAERAERDALRKEVDNLCKYADRYRAMASEASDQLAAARNEALEEAAKVCTGDEERPGWVSSAMLRRMSIHDQFMHEQRGLAWKDADEIRALKSTAPAPRETFQDRAKPWEFDAPYSLTRTETLGEVWYRLSAHGVRIASFSVESWGNEQACIEAAWHHAYGTAPREVTVQEAARVLLANRWAGYGNSKAMQSMCNYVHADQGRMPFPASFYDGVMQAGLQAIAQEDQSDE